DADFNYVEPFCLNDAFDVPLPFEATAVVKCAPGQGGQNQGPEAVDLGDFISLEAGAEADKGTCANVLQQWAAGTLPANVDDIDMQPVQRCYDPTSTSFELTKTFCEPSRFDLLKGKVFSAAPQEAPRLVGLTDAIVDAFRYKTKFINRDGTSLGYTPVVCKFGVEEGEYCYAPDQIELARERLDCATWLYTDHFAALAPTGDQTRATLRSYLQNGWGRRAHGPLGQTLHSFERLYSDLLVSFADDAYSAAFAGRFDLAGEATETFKGSKFELGGIDLTGGAGFEMFNLYKAVQYQEMVLDRFYHATPSLWRTLNDPALSALTYVTADTVVRYMDRVVRASSQKARTWSEIARRYHAFGEPQLARRVLERAYSSVYVESMLIQTAMKDIIGSFQTDAEFAASVAQLRLLLDNTQLKYTQALLRMRDLREDLNAGLTYFGFDPEYIPSPALPSPGAGVEDSAFELLLGKAKARAQTAAQKEDLALAQSKGYETDQAAFEQELIALRNNYKEQLRLICGTFVGDDGNVYPAVTLYADYAESTQQIQNVNGDICGFMDNGEITVLRAGATTAELSLARVANEQGNILERVNIERDRVSQRCQEAVETADFKIKVSGTTSTLNEATHAAQGVINGIATARKTIAAAGALEGSGGLIWSDTAKTIFKGVVIAAGAAAAVAAVVLDVKAAANTNKISQLQQAEMTWEMQTSCDMTVLDSNAKTRELVLELAQVELNAVDGLRNLSIALNQVEAKYRKVTDLIHELAELEQAIINVAAAKNDPSSRIYKNNSIVTADRTFERAMKSAYQATKVFEYHTSQSYLYLGDLFLVRMVQYGPNTLEQYLDELEEAYETFQETYGQPDVRVAVLSLKEDILQIPHTVGDLSCGTTQAPSNHCSIQNRVDMMRERLRSPQYIDENGYITLPFKTGLKQTSPLTRNHKVYSMEAELVGADLGDASGRLYVRQRGVGTLSTLDNQKNFYAFDARTGVLDAWFNGEKPYDADIYTSWRFRERPLVNSGWELSINTVDEQVNGDINLGGLEDIRLYIYYTDFTVL
ncbi:MAG: hypothetical protein ACI9OJ_004935, partial [Myxococcota bacterium]